MFPDGDIDGQRREHVHSGGAKEIGVDLAPGGLRLEPQPAKTHHNHHVLNIGQKVVVEIVDAGNRSRDCPEENDVSVHEHPPGEQKTEIEITETDAKFTAPEMRLEQQSGDGRNAVDKEDDIADVDVRHGMVKKDLVIGPLELADKPERAGHG